MIKRLICEFLGHKELKLQTLQFKGLIQVYDQLNQLLLDVKLCERCHTVYWEFGDSIKSKNLTKGSIALPSDLVQEDERNL